MSPEYEVNMFYWLQDRKTTNYMIGHCYDPSGKFSLNSDGTVVDTEEVKPIGPASKPLAYYIGNDQAEEWVHSRLEGG